MPTREGFRRRLEGALRHLGAPCPAAVLNEDKKCINYIIKAATESTECLIFNLELVVAERHLDDLGRRGCAELAAEEQLAFSLGIPS